MKILKVTIATILLTFVFLQGLKIYRDFNISRDLNTEKKIKLNKSAEILNKCFDLKNKSQRTITESLKLVEYCIKEYGTKIN